MATQNDNPVRSASSTVAEASRSGSRVVEFDEFIDAQLRMTRSHVRSVDIATSLMLLVAGTLAYFLVAALFDHWIVTGGLGFRGRLLFLSVYAVAALTFLVVRVVPLFLHKINPLYAAHTIERSQPSLKNSLVNFLFFRGDRSGLSPVVYQAVEEQAATKLAGAHPDTAVDRSNLVKIGYVLLGILFVGAAYALISPKGLFQTVGRIAAPWAEISAPTSTTITQIEPGDTQAFRGQQIEVTARIQDLPNAGKVLLYYTTADGQIVDRATEMTLASDGYKHTAMLPAGSASLQQNLQYRIEAGDAITRPFHAEVVAAPTIFVDTVDYQYPKYTGLLAQRVERRGDIKAIEGTRVTIEGLANGNIASAHLDFDCDGTLDQRMTVDGPRAKAVFRLALDSDRKQARHGSYQLVFTNEQGQRNPQPVRHEIEVTRDIPPRIEFVAPSKDEVDLPANGVLTWEIVANDPDFALRMVKLSAAKGKQPLFDKLVLNETRPGQFVAKFRFAPAKLGLKEGDVVEYWALAEDNKDPRPNRTETPKRRIRIVAPGQGQPDQDQLAGNDQDGKDGQQSDDARPGSQAEHPRDEHTPPEENPDQPQEGDPKQGDSKQSEQDRNASSNQPGDDQQGEGQQGQGEQGKDEQDQGQQGKDEQGEGQQGEEQQGEGADSDDKSGGRPGGQQRGDQDQQQGEEPGVASDGSNDGDAIERILKHRQQQQGDQSRSDERQEQPPRQRQPSGEQPDGDQQQAGDQPSDERSAGDKRQPSGKQQPDQDDKSVGRQQSKSSDRGEKQQDRPQEGQQDSPPGEKRDQQSDADKRPADQQDQRQSSDQRRGDDKPGDQKADRQQGQSSKDARQPEGKPGGDKENSKQEPPGDEAQQDGSPQEAQGDKGQRGGQSQEGQGAQSKSDPMGDKSPASRDAQRPDAKGGDGQRDKGESGAGKKSQDNQGSPSPQDFNQPRDKSPQPSAENEDAKQDPNQPQSPSNSKRESDSAGDEDGDRSGGGKRGGGQKANKPGTGGPGQNTAADEGAGASQQAGDGETSDRAGDDRAADKQTGQSGSDKGAGSGQRPSSDDGEPGSESATDAQGGTGDAADKPPSDSNSAPGGGTPSGGQGGKPPNDQQPPERPYRTAPEVADKANLEYAREATDLALSHLKDELGKDQPDQELLDNLGWTRDDLQKFVERWEQMRNSAQPPSDEGRSAKRELDDTLRSLGLRPRATQRRANDARNDQFKGLRESRRSTPPPEYVEQTKAYTQGTARGGK